MPRLTDGSRNMQRDELSVDVRDVNEGHVANGVEAEQLLLGQALLCKRTRPAAGENGCCRGRHLQKIAPREHPKLPHYAHCSRRPSGLATLM